METIVTDQLTTTIANDLGQLVVVRERVDAFGARNVLPDDVVFDVKLAIEELLTNTIKHGFSDDGAHTIDIYFDLQGDRLRVRIEDDAVAFDPADAKSPDTEAAFEDRPVGGLGVHLVKNLMDDVDYRREGGRNHVTLTKRLAER